MMARPIHHFLKEFASDDTPFQPPLPKPVVMPEKVAPTPAPDVLASRLQAAFQEGLAAGRAMEREATEGQAAELAVDFDRRIGEVGATFSTTLADGLAAELRTGIEAASARISSNVATALVPFLREGLTRAAIASFVKELGDVMDTTGGMVVEVGCPKEILESLRERMAEAMAARGAPTGSTRFVPNDAAEIRVTLNETVIETRLAEWLSRLEEVLR
jgi:hypothetical protein